MSVFKEPPPDFWEGCSPENVLLGVVAEADQPILMIEGYAKMLLKADLTKEQQIHALKSILAGVAHLSNIMKVTREYTRALSKQSNS